MYISTKHYLGDAVYAELDRGMIKLTTEDGRNVTNTIYLEPFTYESLIKWVLSLPDNNDDGGDDHG